MPASLGDVYVEIGADTQKLVQGFSKAGNLLKGFLAVSGVKKATEMIKEYTKKAMDIEESEGLFTVSLKNRAKEAKQWTESLQKSLGLNAYEIRNNLGLMYNFTTSMGLTGDTAYQLSKNITLLSTDLASFFNTSGNVQFQKLQSALSGQTEPLARQGIIVNETTTKLYAYKHGIAKVGQELSQQQKVLARYGVIMQATKNAQGDLARTLESPSNQLMILNMQLDLARINFGKAFIPVFQKVLPVLKEFALSLVEVGKQFAIFMRNLFPKAPTEEAKEGIGNINDNLYKNIDLAGESAKSNNNLANSLHKVGKNLKGLIAGFDKVNALTNQSSENSDDIVSENELGKYEDLDDNIGSMNNNFQYLFNNIEKLRKPFKELWNSIKNLGNSLGIFMIKLDKLVKKVTGKNIFENVIEGIDKLAEIASKTVDMFTSIVELAGDLLDLDFKKFLEDLKKLKTNTKALAETAPKSSYWDEFEDEKFKSRNMTIYEMAEKFKKLSNDVGLLRRTKSVLSHFGKSIIKLNKDFEEATKIDDSKLAFSFKEKLGRFKKSLLDWWENYKSTHGMDSDNSIGNFGKWFKYLWDKYDLGEKFKLLLLPPFVNSLLTWWKDFKNNHDTNKPNSIGNFGKWFKELWENENVIEYFKDKVSKLIDVINNLWQEFKKKLSSLFRGDEIQINGTITTGDTEVGKVEGITVTGTTPDWASFAEGGLVSSPTLAYVGDNPSGNEAILPLDNTKAIDSIGGVIANAVMGGMNGGNSNTNVVLQIDGRELARALIPNIDNEKTRRSSAKIITD